MILSDVEILEYLEAGRIDVSPLDDIDEQVQPASVDLRLSTEFCRFERDRDVRVKPDGSGPAEVGEYDRHSEGEEFGLEPGAFVLASTRERLEVPDDVCGLLFGRSRFGRLGVVSHVGAGFVNPGWRGRLTLELANHGPHTVVLAPGETRIVQIAFLELTGPAETPYGERPDSRYQDQDGVVPSRETAPKSDTG